MSPTIFNGIAAHAWQRALAFRPQLTVDWITVWDEFVPSMTLDMQERLMEIINRSGPGTATETQFYARLQASRQELGL